MTHLNFAPLCGIASDRPPPKYSVSKLVLARRLCDVSKQADFLFRFQADLTALCRLLCLLKEF